MKSTQNLIEEELLRLCQEGNIEAFFLFNEEGIPMAGVNSSAHLNADGIAALSVILHQSAELTEEFQENALVDEVSLRITNKHRIVSRPFLVDDIKLILIAVVPQHVPYRRITTTAVRRVQQLF